MFNTISPAPVAPIHNQHSTKSRKGAPEGPVYAVLEMEVQGDYRPKNSDAAPCEELGSWPADLVCQVAAMYNAHRTAIKNRKWACVALNGSMFYLCNVQAVDRPTDPTSFPANSRTGLTYDEALAIQEQNNSERLKHAQVPRRWTIALRPLAVQEGGAE